MKEYIEYVIAKPNPTENEVLVLKDICKAFLLMPKDTNRAPNSNFN